MHVHTWFHTVYCVEASIISHENKILHVTRQGILRGIYMQVYTMHVIYMARLLAVEAWYTIQQNN